MKINSITPTFRANNDSKNSINNGSKALLTGIGTGALVYLCSESVSNPRLANRVKENNKNLDDLIKSAPKGSLPENVEKLINLQKEQIEGFIKKQKKLTLKAAAWAALGFAAIQLIIPDFFTWKKQH